MAYPPGAERNDAVWQSENGKLVVRRCNSCEQNYHYPRPFCPFCMSADTSWLEASGRGEIYSFSIVRQRDAEPYVMAFVALDEGVTLMTNIVDTPLDRIAIGLPVEVSFRDVKGQLVPMFKQIS